MNMTRSNKTIETGTNNKIPITPNRAQTIGYIFRKFSVPISYFSDLNLISYEYLENKQFSITFRR